MSNRSPANLEEPGAGLPGGERTMLSALLKTSSVIISDRRALSIFETEKNNLLEIANKLNVDQLCEQVLVPRLAGIEDSSRNWSVIMVLDHLNQVNRTIMETLDLLDKNIEPKLEVSIADFKPDNDIDISVLNSFENLSRDYTEFIDRSSPLKSRFRYYHPWFGLLSAHQWHCLAAFHMRIHRRQAHKITTLQGLA